MTEKSQLAKRTEITRFKVFSRVRPFIQEELQHVKGNIFTSVVEMIGNKTILLDPETMTSKNSFEFDKSLWSIPKTQKVQQIFADTQRDRHDTQQDVYNLVGRGCVEDSFAGYNSCILTYGQTGSGKTHTMMGRYDPKVTCGGEGEEGLIPRVCCDLFVELDKRRAIEAAKPNENDRITYTVELTFVEIYLEKVRDLLDPALERGRDIAGSTATIRESPVSGPYLENVKRYKVESWADCCKHLERGSRHRTTSATLVHNQSSRSHAIFQLTILQSTVVPAKDKYSAPGTNVQAARINLVDLAGSERGGSTDYVKESAAINTSLLALRRVIDNLVARQDILMELQRAELEAEKGGASVDPAIANAARNPPAVPYRESVLTWLLRDSLGGNARTTMIANLSPLAKNYGDTLSTLQWSSKARKLVSVVQKNDPQTTMTNNRSELQSNLMIRQQNLNDLRSTLDAKREETENMLATTETIKKATAKNWKDAENVRRQIHAVKIQCAYRAHVKRNEAKRLSAEKARHERILSQAKDTKKEEESLLARRNEDETVKQDDLQQLKASVVKTQADIKTHKGNAETFAAKKEKVTTEYEALKKEIADGEAEYAKEVKDLTEANEAQRATVASCEEKCAASKALVGEMKAETVSLSKIDFEGEIAALEAEIAAAREKLTEAQARKETAQKNKLDIDARLAILNRKLKS